MSRIGVRPDLVLSLFAFLTTNIALAADPPAKPPAHAEKPAAQPALRSEPESLAIIRAREGVVIIERQGRVVGLGSVLHGDGRVLTAFSAVVQGGDFDLRYSDDSVARAHITHSDRALDLALLTVNGEPRKRGLKAASSPSVQKTSTSFSVAPAKKLLTNRLTLKGPATFVATSGKPIGEGLELATTIKPSDVGTPLLNETGEVIAVVARACPPNSKAKCAPLPYAAPVSSVRTFLRNAVSKVVPTIAPSAPPAPPTPWLGVDIIPASAGPVRGGRITNIHPQSPAAAAGLKAGTMSDAELIVAVDGVPVASPSGLSTALRDRKVGETVEVLLFGAGRFRHVSLVVQSMPPTAPQVRTLDPWPSRAPASGPKPGSAKPAGAPGASGNR